MTKLKRFDIALGWSVVDVPSNDSDEMFAVWLRKLGADAGAPMVYAKDDGSTADAYRAFDRDYGYIVHIEICGNAETILCSGMVDVMEFMRVHSFEYVGE